MPPSLTSAAVASGLVLSQMANLAAASACFDPAVTAVDDPPQLPVFESPAVHWGSGATFHLPAVAGAFPESTPGAQTALGQVSSVPLLSWAFHSGVNMGLLSMAPSLTRPPQ